MSLMPVLITVKLSAINRDPKNNYSRSRPADVKGMAESIKARGRIDNPPIVRENKSGKFTHELISGFTRCGGWEELHGPDADIVVQVVTVADENEQRLINLTENVARSDISRYDLARNVFDLEKRGYKQTKIAAALDLYQSYVSTYLTIWTGLCPTVKDWWKGIDKPENEPPTTTLKKWASVPEAEQKARLQAFLDGTDYDAEHPDESSEGEGDGEGSEASAKMRGKKEIKEQLAKLTEKKEDPQFKDDEKLLGRIAALKWVLGVNKTI